MAPLKPIDRLRKRQDAGPQPYADAREEMSENEAELRNRAEEPWLTNQKEGEEARIERLKAEAEDRLKKVQQETKELQSEAI